MVARIIVLIVLLGAGAYAFSQDFQEDALGTGRLFFSAAERLQIGQWASDASDTDNMEDKHIDHADAEIEAKAEQIASHHPKPAVRKTIGWVQGSERWVLWSDGRVQASP